MDVLLVGVLCACEESSAFKEKSHYLIINIQKSCY